ncbi:response regulator [Sphingomonas sp.]|uniref:response regulator n=1 Tax=Sphingomonas sp. TaxID=28214 RepID=UPI002C644898|nr:response regulator [Sphingomonas sp.]HTG37177.1 response regulator [Sphingomonas sp.]
MRPEPVTILAVDDVEENLTALEALLGSDEVVIKKARSGMEALELLLVEDVALALLDVQMPGMDGFELAELMRGTERTRRVPIIFLTAVATDERRTFRGYETGAIDYLLKPVDTQIVRSKVAVFVELFRQRRELARQRDEHAAALARLQAHRDNSPLAIVEVDPALCILAWSQGAERLLGWRAAEVEGFAIGELHWLEPDDVATVAGLADDMMAGRRLREMRPLSLRTAEGGRIDCECYCSALLDISGVLVSINVQILDVTARKRAEATQQLLIGELNHRVKNTLASVQAIATQTLRHSTGPSDFAPTFIGRIHALARAHSLLSSTTWQGASLRELIEGQIQTGTIEPSRLHARGPELDLKPEPALHLALVLHELTTNAHKYGALSVPQGRVSLDWSVGDGILTLNWCERGGPPAAPPARRGFGSALIERSLRAEGGTAAAEYGRAGLTWRLTLPYDARPRAASQFETQEAASRPAPTADSPRSRPTRVLVIEDEPLIGMEISALLADNDIAAIGPVATRDAALTAIRSESFDAALLDGNLQGETVEAVALALRERAIPFVFVTGYGHEHLPMGFDGHPVVSKPFAADELLDRLSAAVADMPA